MMQIPFLPPQRTAENDNAMLPTAGLVFHGFQMLLLQDECKAI